MSVQDNIRVVEMYFEGMNAHDVGRLKQYLAPGYTFEAPGLPGPVGADEDAAYTQGFFDAFPDLHFDLTLKIAQDDLVVVNWVGTGTHTGPLRTPTGNLLAPTGKRATNSGSNTVQFESGKIIHSWLYFDMVTLLAQLGLVQGV